jgi:hypothetical protein
MMKNAIVIVICVLLVTLIIPVSGTIENGPSQEAIDDFSRVDC